MLVHSATIVSTGPDGTARSVSSGRSLREPRLSPAQLTETFGNYHGGSPSAAAAAIGTVDYIMLMSQPCEQQPGCLFSAFCPCFSMTMCVVLTHRSNHRLCGAAGSRA